MSQLRISELIAKLKRYKNLHGDGPVKLGQASGPDHPCVGVYGGSSGPVLMAGSLPGEPE